MTLVNEWIKASKLSSNAGKVKYISFYKPGVNDVISLKHKEKPLKVSWNNYKRISNVEESFSSYKRLLKM